MTAPGPRRARPEEPTPYDGIDPRFVVAVGVVLVLVAFAVGLVNRNHDDRQQVGTGGSSRSTAPTAPPSGSSASVLSTGSDLTSGDRQETTASGSTSSSPMEPSSTRPATTTSTTTAIPTTTANVSQPASITMAFAGDLLPHTPVTAQAARDASGTGRRFDFDPMLAPMAPIISRADVAICHMETPVAPDQNHLTGYPAFGGPLELVDGAKQAGYDGCSNASNHSIDKGVDGVRATLDRFDQDGLRHAGMARSAEEADATTIYDVRGVKVAHLSYAYDFNGYHLPADAPWAANQIDPARIHADATKARARGADLVVVSLHFGTEYDSQPSAYQRDVVAQLVPSPDIDLIVGAHAHVVQPVDQIAGTFVIWGMGNQLSNQQQVPKIDGLTAIATASKGRDRHWHVTGVEGVPTYVESGSYRVLPVVPTLADPRTPPGLRVALSASYDRTSATVLRDHPAGVTVAPKP